MSDDKKRSEERRQRIEIEEGCLHDVSPFILVLVLYLFQIPRQ
jgi:hypothetical protein